MNRYKLRALKRAEIRQRHQAGEPVQQLLKTYLFMRPRRRELRAQ